MSRRARCFLGRQTDGRTCEDGGMVRPAAFIITIGKRRRHYCDVCVRIEAEAAIGFGETFTVTPIAD